MQLHYYKGILKKLTFRKVGNAALLYAGYYLSKVLRRPIQMGMPIFASIEPSTACNLRCPQCPSGLRQFTRPTGTLTEETFEKAISQMHRHLHSMTFYFQGEPFLHKKLLTMVKRASDHNIYTITSTNAHFITPKVAADTVESGLDKLIISIDGLTQESYAAYRVEGELQKVLDATTALVEEKRRRGSHSPHLVWQFIVFAHNEHEVEEVKALGQKMGVDEVQIKTAQIYDVDEAYGLMPANERYARYKKEGTSYQIRNKLLNHCWRMWKGCVITWDGKVVPCCFDKDADHRMGDLSHHSFREIWKGDAYTDFRKKVITGRKGVDICTNCSEGTNVFAD